MAHKVSAFVQANQLVLAQVACDGKGRELDAIERLLALLELEGAVENNLRWQLDVSFEEDRRRIRKNHGPEYFSRLCRIALNLLQNENTAKCGIKTKRLCCGWRMTIC